jgi:signal transduction histidine kinase
MIASESLPIGPGAPEVAGGVVRAGDYLSQVVADTGAGIAPEVLDRATEPFFSTKDCGTGSGHGLSAVYGFAHQSQAHLLLQSEPGRGTCVRLLLLPLSKVELKPLPP